jgi:WD40 repeat protein
MEEESKKEEGVRQSWRMLPSSPNWYCSQISAWTQSGIYAFACKNSISLLDFSARQFCGELSGHKGRVTAVCMSFDLEGRELCITGSADNSVKVWSLLSQSYIASSTHHKADVTAIATLPSQPGTLISSDKKGVLARWMFLGTSEQAVKVCKMDSPITALACCPYSDVAAVGFQTGRLVLVNTTTMTVQKELIGHEDEVQSIRWNRFGPVGANSWIATSSRDKLVRVWRSDDGSAHCVLRAKRAGGKDQESRGGQKSSWISIGWTNQNSLLSSSPTGSLLLWQVPANATDKELSKCTCLPNSGGHTRTIFSISPSPVAPHLVVTTGMDRMICAWDMRKPKAVWNMSSLGGYVYSCDSPSWQPNLMAAAVGDKTIRIWNTGRPADPYKSTTVWKGMQSKVGGWTVVFCFFLFLFFLFYAGGTGKRWDCSTRNKHRTKRTSCRVYRSKPFTIGNVHQVSPYRRRSVSLWYRARTHRHVPHPKAVTPSRLPSHAQQQSV